MGYMLKAAERLKISLRTDVRDNMLAWLARLVRRARSQTVKLMPSIDARKWRQDAAKGLTVCPKSNKSIRSYRTRLVQLGLIDAHDYGQFWVIRFRFSLATLQSLLTLKSGGKVSPHTLSPEGDSPTENPPSAVKKPSVKPSTAPALGGAVANEGPDQEQAKENAIAQKDWIDGFRKQLHEQQAMRNREAVERRRKRFALMAAPT